MYAAGERADGTIGRVRRVPVPWELLTNPRQRWAALATSGLRTRWRANSARRRWAGDRVQVTSRPRPWTAPLCSADRRVSLGRTFSTRCGSWFGPRPALDPKLYWVVGEVTEKDNELCENYFVLSDGNCIIHFRTTNSELSRDTQHNKLYIAARGQQQPTTSLWAAIWMPTELLASVSARTHVSDFRHRIFGGTSISTTITSTKPQSLCNAVLLLNSNAWFQ